MQLTPLVARESVRCPLPTHGLTAAFPRGRVRPADLARLRVELDESLFDDLPDFEKDPYIELRCGDFPLGRVPLRGEDVQETVALPSALRAKLRGLRGRITWGRFDSPDSQARGDVWIDAPSARERRVVERLHRRLAAEPQWIRRILEAQLLLDQAFDHAALLVARSVLFDRPGEPHAAALLQAGYTLMGLQDLPAADAHDTDVVRPLRENRRRRQAPPCHLDRAALRLRPRVERPAGGCGG